MLPFIIHVYHFAEVYTVVLAWVVIPLAFFACYRFYREHYGMFLPSAEPAVKPVEVLVPHETPVTEEQKLDGAA